MPCLDESRSHEPKLLKKSSGNLPAQVSPLAWGATRARVPALLHEAWVGRDEQGEGAIRAREGAGQWALTPGKTISPQVRALGQGDKSGEGCVDGEVEGRNAWRKFPDQVLICPKPLLPAYPLPPGARAHRPTHCITFLSHSFVPLHAFLPHLQPPTSPSSECQHPSPFSSAPDPAPFSRPPAPVTQAGGCFSPGLSFPPGCMFQTWSSGLSRQTRAAHREAPERRVFTLELIFY